MEVLPESITSLEDWVFADDRSPVDPSAIDEIISVLDFTMSRSESKFLVDYVRWRMDHPIVK